MGCYFLLILGECVYTRLYNARHSLLHHESAAEALGQLPLEGGAPVVAQIHHLNDRVLNQY